MPRKPKRHYNSNRAIYHQAADPERAAKRIEARARFLRQIEKERQIGPDPKYDHSRGRSEIARLGERQKWKSISDEYDREVK